MQTPTPSAPAAIRLDISIARARRERMLARQGKVLTLERGNGHTSNRGPLKPGDFGVHSHPDTARLLRGDKDL